MKKKTAAALSFLMAAAMLAGCGNKIDNNSAETTTTTTAASVSETVTEPVSSDDTHEETVDTKGEYTKAYTEKLKKGVYAMDATVTTSMFGETPLSFKVNGEDLYVKMSTMGIDVEVYQKEGKSYNLMPQMKTYVVSKATTLEQQGVNNYALNDGAEYLGNESEEGLIVEKYKLPILTVSSDISLDISIDAGSYECKYYYTKSGDLKKIFVNSPSTGETTVEINSLSFEDVTIELPDLTDWTEMTQGEKLDKVATIKMGLAVYGVTDEMVEKAGYTYEQLAEMDEQEVTEVLTKIAEDNGLNFDANA